MYNSKLYMILSPILRQAGAIIRSAHGMEERGEVIEKSGDANFVTVYDVRVQSYLIEALQEQFPNARFIAEEQENDPSTLLSDTCFVIDPIDGTTNFIHDYRHSSVSVAMFSHGETVCGAIYDPYLDELFFAEKGKGAYLNGRSMQASCRDAAHAVAILGSSPYYKAELSEKTFSMAKEVFEACADIRRSASAALDLAYIAAGRAEVFFELRLAPWDWAAGELMIREAGGRVSDMRGQPLDLSAPSSIIAANTVNYPLLARIAEKYAD